MQLTSQLNPKQIKVETFHRKLFVISLAHTPCGCRKEKFKEKLEKRRKSEQVDDYHGIISFVEILFRTKN